MIELLKYIKGYVRIKISGISPERFMNLCSNRDILLWNIMKDKDVYTMCISLKAFYQLRPIARKTGTRVVILERVGLPFLMSLLLARKVFIAGLIFCVAFWIGSSYFIWDIEFFGNYQITDDMLEHFLKEQDIKAGMSKHALDIGTLEKEIRRTFNEVTWTSAKLTGTKLLIEIKENDVPLLPIIKEDEGGKDLIALFDGTVVSMIVRNGIPKVSIGEEVSKGMILVEGKVPIYNEDTTVREYRYVTSDADIVIRHDFTHTETLPFSYIKNQYSGRIKKGYMLRLGDKEWKLTMDQPFLVYDSMINEKTLYVLKKLNIPVFLGQITYREYYKMECRYTKEQAETVLKQKINQFFQNLSEKGVHIIEKNVRIETESEKWVLIADLTVEEAGCEVADTFINMNQSSLEAGTME